MNANVKGMLWTAGAIVVGIVVANLVQAQISARGASASDEE